MIGNCSALLECGRVYHITSVFATQDLLGGMHGHQKKTLAFFVLGMVLSGCAVLQRVAETLSERGISEAKMSSIERRLSRFIANERIVVPMIWKLFFAQVLPSFRGQKLHFVLDNTPFQDELPIVYIGLLLHSRVLPLAWAVMPAKTTWEEDQWHIVARVRYTGRMDDGERATLRGLARAVGARGPERGGPGAHPVGP